MHVFVYITVIIIYAKVKHHEVSLDTTCQTLSTEESKWTLGHLLGWISDNLLSLDRKELFLKDKTETNNSKLDVKRTGTEG